MIDSYTDLFKEVFDSEFGEIPSGLPSVFSLAEADDGRIIISIATEGHPVSSVDFGRGEYAKLLVSQLMQCSNELFAEVLSQLQTRMAAGGRDAA